MCTSFSHIISFIVIDDENPTEVTAGAIVTVTVNLVRKDMSVLFGDETVEENNVISENGVDNDKAAGDVSAEVEQAVKRPAWLKQKRTGGKKSKKLNKQSNHRASNVIKQKVEGSPAPIEKKKVVKEEKPKDDDSEDSDVSEVIETNDHNDKSSEDDTRKSADDDDQVCYFVHLIIDLLVNNISLFVGMGKIPKPS